MERETDGRAAELRRIAGLELPLWCKTAALGERALFRFLRLAVGAGIVGGAIWLFRIAADTLGQPFASLSPLGLIGGLLAGLGGLISIGIAIRVSFGPKRHSAIEQAWRERQGNTKKLLGYDE